MKSFRFLPVAAGFAMALANASADISTDGIGPAPAAAAPSPAPVAPNVPLAPPSADTAGSSTSSTTDSAKIAGFERRFAQGRELEQQGKLTEALAVFNGILAEAPDAKGSLREAGVISVHLGDYLQADSYFSKLHALVPEYPMAIEALIQVNQTLKRDAKVEILIKHFKDLWAAGKVPEPYFVRERIHLDNGTEIVISQFFDYHQPQYYAWAAELFDASHRVKRRLTVNYDPEVTQSLRAKDPSLAHAEQFLLVDNVLADDKVTRLDVYQQFLALPEYVKVRDVMLEVFAHGLKPIDSAPVPQGAP